MLDRRFAFVSVVAVVALTLLCAPLSAQKKRRRDPGAGRLITEFPVPDVAPIDVEAVKVFANGNGWISDSINKVAESGQLDLIVDAEVSLDDDTKVSVNMTNVPLIDVQDQRIGGMLVFEDISREKRMKSTMSRYMSRQLVDQLVEAGDVDATHLANSKE